MPIFKSRAKNSSYEGWYADIDTAVILEINRLGRVTGVTTCSQLNVMDAQYYRASKFDRRPEVCRMYQGFPNRRPDQLEGWQQTFEVSVETAAAESNLESANGALDGIWALTILVLVLFIPFNLEKGQATEIPFFLITAFAVFLMMWNRQSKCLHRPAGAINIWVQRVMCVALIGSWVAWWNL